MHRRLPCLFDSLPSVKLAVRRAIFLPSRGTSAAELKLKLMRIPSSIFAMMAEGIALLR